MNLYVEKKGEFKHTQNKSTSILTSKNKPKQSENNDSVLRCLNDFESLIDPEIKSQFFKGDDIVKLFKINKTYFSQLSLVLNDSSKENEHISIAKKFLSEQKTTPMVNYTLVFKCVVNLINKSCDDEINRAIEEDPNNAGLWFQIAFIKAKEKNISYFRLALQQIISAPNFYDFYPDIIDAFNQALIEVGMYQDLPRRAVALGFTYSLSYPPMNNIISFCKEQAKENAELTQLCLDAGRRIAKDSTLIQFQQIGLAIQKAIYQVLDDKEAQQKIELINSSLNKFKHKYNEAKNLMMFDLELQQYWFEQLKLFGEKKALKQLHTEAVRLSANPNYSPCRK